MVQQDMIQIANNQQQSYQSGISDFLVRMQQRSKKRVVCIVSDFLALSAADVDRLLALAVDHHLVLLRLVVDPYEGKNYIGMDVGIDRRLHKYMMDVIL